MTLSTLIVALASAAPVDQPSGLWAAETGQWFLFIENRDRTKIGAWRTFHALRPVDGDGSDTSEPLRETPDGRLYGRWSGDPKTPRPSGERRNPLHDRSINTDSKGEVWFSWAGESLRARFVTSTGGVRFDGTLDYAGDAVWPEFSGTWSGTGFQGDWSQNGDQIDGEATFGGTTYAVQGTATDVRAKITLFDTATGAREHEFGLAWAPRPNDVQAMLRSGRTVCGRLYLYEWKKDRQASVSTELRRIR